MKVLHIGKYFPPYAGGMETYLRDLMAAQGRQGIRAFALVHQSGIGFKSQDETYNAGEQALPVTRAAVWARLLFTPISPTFLWLLRGLIKTEKPDMLHLHMPNVSVFWALLLPSARKISWVIHWHSDVLASAHHTGLRLFYALYRPFERAVLRKSAAIIATSPPYLESSEPLRDFSEKCHVVPLGLAPANTSPRASFDEAPDTAGSLRVLAVGRLTYYKGFEYLIRAAALVEDIEVNLVGTGDLDKSLRDLAQELGVDQRVTFHGHLSDGELEQQYDSCDCLCLPSIERTEAFGMVLLEAMSHSRATVVSAVPGSGMAWVADDGITGLHVLPKDAHSLANCLRNLRDNRDKIRALGGSGREKFDRLFQIDKSAAEVSSLYRDILDLPARQ